MGDQRLDEIVNLRLKHLDRPLSAWTQCGTLATDQDPTSSKTCPACAMILHAARAKFGRINRNFSCGSRRLCVTFRGRRARKEERGGFIK